MFEICIDNEGYYAEGVTENRVTVEKIPDIEDVRYLKAYKFENNNWVLDAVKLENIKSTLNNNEENNIPTENEQLDAIEAAIM